MGKSLINSKTKSWSRISIKSICAGLLAGLLAIAITAIPPPHALTLNGSTAYPAYTYTCCTSISSDATLHPDETLDLSWSAYTTTTSDASPTKVTLSTYLSGPYPTIRALKASVIPDETFTRPVTAHSQVIRVSDLVAVKPVSVLRIPANAQPGYYNVFTVSSSKSDETSAATVVRIQ